MQNIRINYARKFKKQYEKANPKIQTAFDNRIELFIEDPFHPLLDNHLLTGNYSGKRSLDITGDWRAIFSEELEDNGNKVVTFEVFGTHSQLYK